MTKQREYIYVLLFLGLEIILILYYIYITNHPPDPNGMAIFLYVPFLFFLNIIIALIVWMVNKKSRWIKWLIFNAIFTAILFGSFWDGIPFAHIFT